MKIRKVRFHPDSFGITQRSLKVLRDTLAESISHRIAVVEVPTNSICCGFLVIDKDTGTATFTGDGFRQDRCGEGGAGYRSAMALLSLYRLNPIPWGDIVNLEMLYQGKPEAVEKELKEITEEVCKSLDDSDFVKPSDKNPYYVW